MHRPNVRLEIKNNHCDYWIACPTCLALIRSEYEWLVNYIPSIAIQNTTKNNNKKNNINNRKISQAQSLRFLAYVWWRCIPGTVANSCAPLPALLTGFYLSGWRRLLPICVCAWIDTQTHTHTHTLYCIFWYNSTCVYAWVCVNTDCIAYIFCCVFSLKIDLCTVQIDVHMPQH